MEDRERLLAFWLSISDFKNSERRELIGNFNEIEKSFNMDPKGETVRTLYKKLGRVLDLCTGIIIPGDEIFDRAFKGMNDAPCLLYYRGNIGLLDKKSVTVAGTRNPTEYGIKITEKICEAISESGYAVVSGGARGVDSISHRTALKNDGKTICVLGGGFNHIYPPENGDLFIDIEREGGLVMTEYHPDVSPRKYFFPERNRIMAYISEITIIPEASENSGSLHTAALALEYGRRIITVPHKIDSDKGAGCNFLIRAGAEFITDVSDLMLYL